MKGSEAISADMERGLIETLPTADMLNRLTESTIAEESRKGYNSDANPINGYKSLNVWQASAELVSECYRLTTKFPNTEVYGLTQQLRRAAVSVSLNIAEGWGRNSKAEFARFCDIARGSLHEVDAAIEVAIRLGYLESQDTLTANSLFKRVGTMLLNLIKSLRS